VGIDIKLLLREKKGDLLWTEKRAAQRKLKLYTAEGFSLVCAGKGFIGASTVSPHLINMSWLVAEVRSAKKNLWDTF